MPIPLDKEAHHALELGLEGLGDRDGNGGGGAVGLPLSGWTLEK